MLLGKILLLLMAKIENIILPSGHTEWPTLVVYVKENKMISLQNGLQRWLLLDILPLGATRAQWIRLYILSFHPGFESQAHHQHFYQFLFEYFNLEKMKINPLECPTP